MGLQMLLIIGAGDVDVDQDQLARRAWTASVGV